jgi:hypothetical protein
MERPLQNVAEKFKKKRSRASIPRYRKMALSLPIQGYVEIAVLII